MESRRLLDGTFGEGSELETANYGPVMRCICVEIGKLREKTFDGMGSASDERYSYGVDPRLVIIDGVKSKHGKISVGWSHSPFSEEARGWGYDPRTVVFVDPETKMVVALEKLKEVAYANCVSKNYTRVLIAVKRSRTKEVFIDEKSIGRYWASNVTIEDVKRTNNVPDDCELIFNEELYDDCTTLDSLPGVGDKVLFKMRQIIPRIILDKGNPVEFGPMEDFGMVIDYFERLCPRMKVVHWSGCQPPRDMKVKDVVKLFGNWETGELVLYTTSNFVHVRLYPEEYSKMDNCLPLVDTYVDGTVNIWANLMEKFALKLPCIREVYRRMKEPLWVYYDDNEFDFFLTE